MTRMTVFVCFLRGNGEQKRELILERQVQDQVHRRLKNVMSLSAPKSDPNHRTVLGAAARWSVESGEMQSCSQASGVCYDATAASGRGLGSEPGCGRDQNAGVSWALSVSPGGEKKYRGRMCVRSVGRWKSKRCASVVPWKTISFKTEQAV